MRHRQRIIVEKVQIIGYNECRKPGVCDISVFLNLQNFKRDSYISVICQASIKAGEGRKADAVAHLAVARSQKTENGISGVY